MPDVTDFPRARALPASRLPRIRSFVTVPVRLSDGSLYGTFRAAGLTSDDELEERDRALMEVLASAASVIIEPGVRARAAEHLDRVSGCVAMNVSPATLLTPACTALLDRLPLERVLLELSEHAPAEDYELLGAVLAPLRARGLRLAIDDVGAGFSSLRHIVLTTPDVIKIDRSIVDGIDADPVLSVLARSLVDFAHGCGARLGPVTACCAAGPSLGPEAGWTTAAARRAARPPRRGPAARAPRSGWPRARWSS